MAEVNWGDCEPFGVDGGELDGLFPAECFTLGVEWGLIYTLAEQPDGFERLIHSQNQDRIKQLLARRNRIFSLKFLPDDQSEEWMWLTVEPEGEQ